MIRFKGAFFVTSGNVIKMTKIYTVLDEYDGKVRNTLTMNLLKIRKEPTGERTGKLTTLRLRHTKNGKRNLLRRKVKTLGIYTRKMLRMKRLLERSLLVWGTVARLKGL